MSRWPEYADRYLMNTVKRVPLTMVRGEGVRAWDDDGREYLDFVGGWAVNSLGHCSPVVVEALREQSQVLIQASNQFYTIPQLRLGELLVQISRLDKVFFCNSGAEAGEGAVKLARRYGKLHLKGAFEVITATNSFHGRTLAMVAATGQKKFQEPYVPLPSGFVNVPYNSIEEIKNAATSSVCAVMLEPIQGEGGVNIPDDGYLAEVRSWCDERGLLLILDEIQTGVGRTGKFFAYEHYGIEPDIVTLAKGLGSGLPIGAIMAKERAAVFSPGEHGSTFGGNPLVCAVSYAVVKSILENNLAENAHRVGNYFLEALQNVRQKSGSVLDVRGKGLLIAVEFHQDIAAEIVYRCMEAGLLVNQVKPNAIRFMPPLIVSEREVDQALDILGKVLANVSSSVS